MQRQTSRVYAPLPHWVPQAARHYLEHTEAGLPIRALARAADLHASTVLRQIRRFEKRRDDPLVDDALRDLSEMLKSDHAKSDTAVRGRTDATRLVEESDALIAYKVKQDALRVLRRLAETGARLAVAKGMDKGVVVREGPDGETHRLAVVDRDVAQSLALQDWISCTDVEARITQYYITSQGRSALKEHLAAAENEAQGFAEAPTAFAHDPERDTLLRNRAGLIDSPLSGLARRRDKDGKPFLSRDLVAAGERLREDYELSQLAADGPPDFAYLLTEETADEAPGPSDDGSAALARVKSAMMDLGPGLSDVALRTCCCLEGMETLEKRMGWSARSGKIVLRIALQRLQRHYQETNGGLGPRIG